PVTLQDQFNTLNVTVAPQPDRLCNPVQKTLPNGTVTPINNPDAHLVCHPVTLKPGSNFNSPGSVRVQNQFGVATLDVLPPNPLRLCLPSFKQLAPPFPSQPQPPGLDHFLCYTARYHPMTMPFPLKPVTVGLADQFENVTANLVDPVTLCNPVKK